MLPGRSYRTHHLQIAEIAFVHPQVTRNNAVRMGQGVGAYEESASTSAEASCKPSRRGVDESGRFQGGGGRSCREGRSRPNGRVRPSKALWSWCDPAKQCGAGYPADRRSPVPPLGRGSGLNCQRAAPVCGGFRNRLKRAHAISALHTYQSDCPVLEYCPCFLLTCQSDNQR